VVKYSKTTENFVRKKLLALHSECRQVRSFHNHWLNRHTHVPERNELVYYDFMNINKLIFITRILTPQVQLDEFCSTSSYEVF
jgi:hypothetical protein